MATGSISKHVAKDGRVSWRVRVDTTDARTGRRTQPQRTFRTRREAEKGLRDWLAAIEQGTDVERSKQTLGAYLTFWLDSVQHRVKPTTLASYRYLTDAYIRPELGGVPVQKLGAQRVQAFYSACLAPTAGHKGHGLSHRTVRYLHGILHSALTEALRLGLVARNVTEAVTPPRPVRHEARAWSTEEVQRFLAVAQGDSLWPLWLIALHTGLRRSEVLGIRWRDLELDAGTLQIRQSVVLVGNTLTIQEGAKRGGHSMALGATCVAALRAHRTAQVETRLAMGPLWEDHDLVFTGIEGKPVHPNTLGRHFRALQREAGVSPLPFHGLRHTHATILMLAGVHPKVVSERLGHADIGITLRTYSHVLPQMHQQAAEIFAAAVKREEEQA